MEIECTVIHFMVFLKLQSKIEKLTLKLYENIYEIPASNWSLMKSVLSDTHFAKRSIALLVEVV